MSTATQTLLTADEFLRLHGDESGIELVDGEWLWGTKDRRTAIRGFVRRPTVTLTEMKRRAYQALDDGSKIVLIFDTVSKMVGVFPSDEFPYRLEKDQVLTLPDLLPGFAVPVREFFE